MSLVRAAPKVEVIDKLQRRYDMILQRLESRREIFAFVPAAQLKAGSKERNHRLHVLSHHPRCRCCRQTKAHKIKAQLTTNRSKQHPSRASRLLARLWEQPPPKVRAGCTWRDYNRGQRRSCSPRIPCYLLRLRGCTFVIYLTSAPIALEFAQARFAKSTFRLGDDNATISSGSLRDSSAIHFVCGLAVMAGERATTPRCSYARSRYD